MKPLAQSRIILAPVRHRHIDWKPVALLLLSAGFTVFVIFCAAKAVR